MWPTKLAALGVLFTESFRFSEFQQEVPRELQTQDFTPANVNPGAISSTRGSQNRPQEAQP